MKRLPFISILLVPLFVGASYDPLRLADAETETEIVHYTLRDADRAREIPVRIFLPPHREAAPVILVSHGLGGSLEDGAYLGKHWAARGYVVLFLQHAGSDEPIWRDVPPEARAEALRSAASTSQLLHRIRDVRFVLDQANEDHLLRNRMDLQRVGITGHSFGAITAQLLSGARIGFLNFEDRRIQAAMLMSPSASLVGSGEQAFGHVEIPWMLMTGTRDRSVISGETAASRLRVYPALPPGGKYELLLEGAEHNAFGDRALGPHRPPRNPNHHRVILALSTAFWDAKLLGNEAAAQWLLGDAPRELMQPGDRFQHK